MTKTELCEKILSYPPTARIDIYWQGGVSNMPLEALQGLVREWQEQNLPKKPPYVVRGLEYYIGNPDAIRRMKAKDIPEPDKDTPPDFNC